MIDPADRLFSMWSHKQVHYLVIPKCGCTFVKNLFWRIDHGANHPNPARVHDDDDDFSRAGTSGYTAEAIQANPYSFTVFRNPIDRFLSLYFDKVVGEGHQRFVPLRDVLIQHHGLDPEATTADEHRRNCMVLIDWIEENLAGASELPTDPHWTPQGHRMGIIKQFDLKILMLQDLDKKLELLLSPVIPDIDRHIVELERNASTKAAPRAELVDKALWNRIASVYQHDMWLTRKAWERWTDYPPMRSDEIPRISQII